MSIKAIDKAGVHQITSGQVIIDLTTAVKEIVENAVDAGATNLEIKFKEYGGESIQIIDNGKGISAEDWPGVALKHHTSKLLAFDDLGTVTTLGFRGEALASLCAMTRLEILTATEESAPIGTNLTFNNMGVCTVGSKTARTRGTTVTIHELFKPLPVRRKKLLQNIKNEYSKALDVITAYSLIHPRIKFSVKNSVKGKWSTTIQTSNASSLDDSFTSLFTAKALQSMQTLDITFTIKPEKSHYIQDELNSEIPVRVTGLISKPQDTISKTTSKQFFYINKRPFHSNPISKAFNAAFRNYCPNSNPSVVANLEIPTDAYDVNVSPDKRTILFQSESSLVLELKSHLIEFFQPSKSTFGSLFSSKVLQNEVKAEESEPEIPIESEVEPQNSVSFQASQPVLSNDSTQTKIPLFRPEEPEDPVIKQEEDINSDELPQISVIKEPQQLNLPQFLFGGPGRTLVLKPKAATTQYRDAPLPDTYHPRPRNFYIDEEAEVEGAGGRDDASDGPETDADRQFIDDLPIGSPQSSHSVSETDDFLINEPRSSLKASRRRCDPFAFEEETEVDRELEVKTILVNAPQGYSDPFEEEEEMNSLDITTILGETPVKRPDIFDVTAPPTPDIPDKLPFELPNSSSLNAGSDISEEVIGDVVLSDVTLDFSIHDVEESWLAWSTHLETGDREKEDLAEGGIDNVEASEVLSRYISKEDFGRMDVIGQFNLGFIICRLRDSDVNDLFIVDQHASDEKWNFEKLQKETKLQSQRLISPLQLTLPWKEEITAIENVSMLELNGYEIQIDESDESQTGSRVKLVSLPMSKDVIFGVEDLEELLEMISISSPGEAVRPTKTRKMFASRACRKSIMIGKALDEPIMKRVLDHMGMMDQPWECPHGRPTMRWLTQLSPAMDERHNIGNLLVTAQ